jgi:hypothetical protein
MEIFAVDNLTGMPYLIVISLIEESINSWTAGFVDSITGLSYSAPINQKIFY